jgi:hypothetical protein
MHRVAGSRIDIEATVDGNGADFDQDLAFARFRGRDVLELHDVYCAKLVNNDSFHNLKFP